MLRISFVMCATMAVVLAGGSAHAAITTWDIANDGDGAIDCTASPFSTSLWNPTDQAYEITIVGNQYWGPGHMVGDIATNTIEDPTMKIRNIIDNAFDYEFDWTGYLVSISMNNSFTISNAVVNTPGNWASPVVTQPTLVGGKYVGSVSYTGGTPVGQDETLDFGYWISFSGKTAYNFCQEMTPVPEPATMSLLLAGLGAACLRKHRQA